MDIRIGDLMGENRHVTVKREREKVILITGTIEYQPAARLELTTTDALAIANALGLIAESIDMERR